LLDPNILTISLLQKSSTFVLTEFHIKEEIIWGFVSMNIDPLFLDVTPMEEKVVALSSSGL
jgi:hypothetical protein